MPPKIIIVNDDIKRNIFPLYKCREMEVSQYMTSYRTEKSTFYDGVNTNAKEFIACRKNSKKDIIPTVPWTVFLSAYEDAFVHQYIDVFVLCPYSEFTDYYYQAKKAERIFMQREDVQKSGFNLRVFDTKTFSAGVYVSIFDIYCDMKNFYFPVNIAAKMLQNRLEKSLTYVIYRDDLNTLHNCEISYTENSELCIYGKDESEQLDKFTEIVLNKYNSCKISGCMYDYCVSFGTECDFADKIYGKLVENIHKRPFYTFEYSIPTAAVFGNKAFCIHIVTGAQFLLQDAVSQTDND
ncbi:MAG: hypothetical protein LUG85_08670 [Clostridiales bacterium]|nr:hypothetical protein [Clostridiales bacterium]